MGTVLTNLDAFYSETEPQPQPQPQSQPAPAPSPGAGVLMRVVDAYPRKDSYVRARRQFRRPITLRRLALSMLRAARAVALFPFVIAAWCLLRIWWLVRLLVTSTWRALISAPASAVRFAIASVRAMLAPSARLRESPPVVRVAIAGVPAWARDVPLVPAIAFALTATAGLSVALALLLLRL